MDLSTSQPLPRADADIADRRRHAAADHQLGAVVVKLLKPEVENELIVRAWKRGHEDLPLADDRAGSVGTCALRRSAGHLRLRLQDGCLKLRLQGGDLTLVRKAGGAGVDRTREEHGGGTEHDGEDAERADSLNSGTHWSSPGETTTAGHGPASWRLEDRTLPAAIWPINGNDRT